jgi:hypothetical protein
LDRVFVLSQLLSKYFLVPAFGRIVEFVSLFIVLV